MNSVLMMVKKEIKDTKKKLLRNYRNRYQYKEDCQNQ